MTTPTPVVIEPSTYLWDFANWDSIWPLPHVILAYNAYLYTRNWISVLCFYYLLKVVQLLLLSVAAHGQDIENDGFFAELLFATHRTGSTGGSLCLVDFNGIFIGGTIQTGLGILLGMTHAYICAPSVYNIKYFHPVTFWKSSATKKKPNFKEAKKQIDDCANKYWQYVGLEYGLWPWQLWFGYYPGSFWLSTVISDVSIAFWRIYYNCWSHYTHQPHSLSQIVNSSPNNDEKWRYWAYKRWKFRRVFWVRWLQLTLLGSPTLLFYSLGGRHSLRAGSIIYGFITCLLLLMYKRYNQVDYIEYLTHCINGTYNHTPSSSLLNDTQDFSLYLTHPIVTTSGDDIKKTSDRSNRKRQKYMSKQLASWGINITDSNNSDLRSVLFHQTAEMTFNSYDTIYSVWIITCAGLIAFQAIPVFTSFYRVILSTTLIILGSLIISKIYATL